MESRGLDSASNIDQRLVVIRDWTLPGFFGMVVEAEEDAIRILNVGDPMAVPRRPHVLLHELRKLRIVFQFHDGLAVDPELFRSRRDAKSLASLNRLRNAFHPELDMVKR